MAAHLDTLTKTAAFGIAALAIAPAGARYDRGQRGQATDAALMSQDRNAGEKHALVARYLR
jgi:hypothetical protein